jgi:ubiquinone/menaquinone biosynthesis C-methylase UbiE
MTDIPYAAWAEYIAEHLKGKTLVADLACGTGSMTVLLAKKGFDMIGIDRSADMLAEARNKAAQTDLPILFLMQDVRRLDLFGTIDAAVSVCDGFNYLLSEAELFAAFSRCALFLNPGGILIFDMNTEYKFKEVLRDDTFTDERDGSSYVWKNYYDENARINEYNVFVMTAGGSSFSETHLQRAYPTETVMRLLTDAGFAGVRVNDAYTPDPPKPDSVRLSFIARKGLSCDSPLQNR